MCKPARMVAEGPNRVRGQERAEKSCLKAFKMTVARDGAEPTPAFVCLFSKELT